MSEGASPQAGAAATDSGDEPYSPAQRRWATVFLMAAAIMNLLDTTIANVALPQIQGTTGATREEVTWVLTSFVIALAIGMPISGWLTARFSRKRVLLGAIAGFTLFSFLCGIATTIEELVVFRIFQGLFGSPVVPLVQTTLLAIFPREEHGKAMAIFGIAGIGGPLIGPMLGGWLTSSFSWGWVFLVNVPVGIASMVGLAATLRPARSATPRPFDFLSFALLAIALAAFQLMLDRGSILDWFDSDEILAEAAVAALAFGGFIWISAKRKNPFIPPRIVTDRNFVVGTGLGFLAAGTTMATMAMLPDLLAQYFGWPIEEIGMVMTPRGLATLVMTPFLPALVRRFSLLHLMMASFFLMGVSSLQLSTLSLEADGSVIALSGFVQGIGASLLWTPMALLTFTSIPQDLRDDAAGLHALLRTLGTAIGISILQTITLRDAVAAHEGLAGSLQMQNLPQALREMAANGALAPMLSAVNAEVTRQAAMISYVDSFWMMFVVQLLAVPVVLFLRPSARTI